MYPSNAYAAFEPTTPLAPFKFERRTLRANDILIDILYCGVCHSDIHMARNEWGGTRYPIVPGHEIVGKVIEIGPAVSHFKVGDIAGIGCFVDSCRSCPSCQRGLEQYCSGGMTGTYNSTDKITGDPTYGGYSTSIVADEKYVLHVDPSLPLEKVAPLLCAGITTFSPLRHWNVQAGATVGVIGLGGLVHMGVKLANAMGAEVTVFSQSPTKEQDAYALGAKHFVLSNDPEKMNALKNSFDLILDTVSAQHDINPYLQLLDLDATMVMLGVPPESLPVGSFGLIGKRRSLAGSLIGGIKETQEMLDFCAEHHITSDVEVIQIDYINQAYERMMKGDVKYRFVIDLASLK